MEDEYTSKKYGPKPSQMRRVAHPRLSACREQLEFKGGKTKQ